MIGLTTIAPNRGTDAWGCGDYGASRGSRAHNGVDYLVPTAAEVLSPVAGKVTKLGYPYGDDPSYRYVQVTTANDFDVRCFYVEPSVKVGDIVQVGDIIGQAQDLSKRYNGMPNHVHLEIKDPSGAFIDPGSYNGAIQ